MCGINVSFIGPEHVGLMNRSIMHRGMRSHVWHDDHVALGHVRLPIQGLDPKYDMPYHYKNWVVCFVGEIYNHPKITQHHHESDVEVLAQAWDNYGPEAFQYFDGMWSVVIYDKVNHTLHLLIDQLAKKPMYYRDTPLCMSSEIKALTFHPYVPDPYYYGAVGKWGYCPRDHVFDYNITKMKSGMHNKIDTVTGGFSSTQYIRLDRRQSPLVETIREAVHNRLISDIPIAVLCSGGLDSSIVLHHVLEVTEDITVFHVENEDDTLDHLNIPSSVKVIDVTLEDVDTMEAMFWNEGPVDLGSMLPQLAIARAIGDHGFHVAISGDGADEVFGGYRRTQWYDSQFTDIFDELQYYHLPRLDKLMMSQTIELRCPFLAPRVIEAGFGMDYPDRINKCGLREAYRGLLSDQIIEGRKIPLKTHALKKDPEQYRYDLLEMFQAGVVPRYYLTEESQAVRRMVEKL